MPPEDDEDLYPTQQQSPLEAIQPKTGKLPDSMARRLGKPLRRADMANRETQQAYLERTRAETAAQRQNTVNSQEEHEQRMRSMQGVQFGTNSYTDDKGIRHAGSRPPGADASAADRRTSSVVAMGPSSITPVPASEPGKISDAQTPQTSRIDAAKGQQSVAGGPETPRLDAFKAQQTPDAGMHSWDAGNPQNAARQQKIAAAVQGVKDAKTDAGIDPSTNLLIGKSDGVDVTGGVINSLDAAASSRGQVAEQKNQDSQNALKGGDMNQAISAAESGRIARRESQAYSDASNKTNSVTMTPYGVIATSSGNLGTGFDRIKASSAVQDAARQQGSPAALAAVNPKPFPRRLNQGAYNPPPSRLAMAN